MSCCGLRRARLRVAHAFTSLPFRPCCPRDRAELLRVVKDGNLDRLQSVRCRRGTSFAFVPLTVECRRQMLCHGYSTSETLNDAGDVALHAGEFVLLSSAALLGSRSRLLTTGRALDVPTAVRASSLPAVQLLLSRGAKANHANQNGETALHIACGEVPGAKEGESKDSGSSGSDRLQIVAYLLSQGAATTMRTVLGDTPLRKFAWLPPMISVCMCGSKLTLFWVSELAQRARNHDAALMVSASHDVRQATSAGRERAGTEVIIASGSGVACVVRVSDMRACVLFFPRAPVAATTSADAGDGRRLPRDAG